MADDNSVDIRFGASTDGAIAAIAEVRGALAGLTESVRGLEGNLSQLTASFGAALPADKVTKTAAAFADQAQAAKIAIEQSQTAAKLAGISYRQTQESLSTQYKLHQITYDQETSALLAALAQRHAAEEAAVNAQIEGAAKGSTAYRHYLNQRQVEDAQYVAARQKIFDQQAVQDQKEWESALKPIQSAWDSQLRKLLGGGESFGKAMKNVFADLVLDIIKKLETLALEKAASGLLGAAKVGPSTLLAGLFGGGQAAAATTTAAQATATTAATASSAATTAAAGGQATTLAANTAALGVLTASIEALTGVFTGGTAATTAQTTATVAQTTATAADTAAVTADTAATSAETATTSASGGGGFLSTISSLLSIFGIPLPFAVGTDMVLSSGLAFLHQGETVIPSARGSGPFTGAGLGGGDTHVHFNVNAIDAPGVQRFFQSNAEQINRVLRSSLQLNPSQA